MTFLRRTIPRIFVDWCRSRHGHWRPSSRARRLGSVAIELDRLVGRDGFTAHEAVETLACRLGGTVPRDELESIAAQVRPAIRTKHVGGRALSHAAAVDSADADCLAADAARIAAKTREALELALVGLAPRDREIVRAIRVGTPVPLLSRQAGVPVRVMRGRIDRVCRQLRRRLLATGVSRDDARTVLRQHGFDVLDGIRAVQ